MNPEWLALLLFPASVFAQAATSALPPFGVEDKLRYHARKMVGPGVHLRVAVAASYKQFQDHPPEWGQGAAGFGRRYASGLGVHAVREAVAFGVDSALRQDPRFLRSNLKGFWPRTRHALMQTLICRNDRGGMTFAAWRVGSAYGTGLISNFWRPNSENTAGDGLVRGTVVLGGDTAVNLLKEFWPDIRKKFLRR